MKTEKIRPGGLINFLNNYLRQFQSILVMKKLLIIFSLSVLFACNQNTESNSELESETMKTEPESKNEETESGLIYELISSGNGPKIQLGNEVHTHIVLTLEEGKEVWTTRGPDGETFSFVLGETGLIAGFEEGVLKASGGDRIKLTIPPYLGYGERGAPPDIPPNATIIFDIEIIEVIAK